MAEPGELHPVDRAFYDLTVAQRNQAWAEVERLKKALYKTMHDYLESEGRPTTDENVQRCVDDAIERALVA